MNRDSISITANSPSGIFYGIQSFLQLFKREDHQIVVPAVRIYDYPEVKLRGVHFNAANLEDIKKQLDLIASFKMNTAIIENWAYFNLDKDDNLEKLREIYKYARDRFIEPIPEIVSFSHAAPFFLRNPYTAEGIWVKDTPFIFKDDYARPLSVKTPPLANLIITKKSNVIITNTGKNKTYQEGEDYVIIKGDTSYPYNVNNRLTRIKRITKGGIKDNQEILISFNYVRNIAKPWISWSIPYCPSSELTYQIVEDVYEKVIRYLSPNYISIGHDEIVGMNRDIRSRRRNLTNAELLAYDINRLYDITKELNPNIKLMIWDDMLNPWHNGGNETYQVPFGGPIGKTAPAIDLIPKNIILMIWWYSKEDTLGKMRNSPKYFEDKGFRYVVAGWNNKENIKEWLKIVKGRENALGIMVTNWAGFKENLENIEFAAKISWEGINGKSLR